MEYTIQSMKFNFCLKIKQEAPLILFYYIFPYKIFVLTCLIMAPEEAKTGSKYVKAKLESK